jgi:hypothetical protein
MQVTQENIAKTTKNDFHTGLQQNWLTAMLLIIAKQGRCSK